MSETVAIGRMLFIFPVNSKTRTIPVMGARTMDAKNPAMPITTNSCHSAGLRSNALIETAPNTAPIYVPKIQSG